MSIPTRRQISPGEKSEIRSGVSVGVGIEEVVGAGIILIHAFLHQTHAEDSGVEIEILLRRAGDGGDVMKAADWLHERVTNHARFRKSCRKRLTLRISL